MRAMENSLSYSNNIVFLDAETISKNIDLQKFKTLGNFKPYLTTRPDNVYERICDAQVIVTNKVVIDEQIMSRCPRLKLICVTATGTNNIDLMAAKKFNILVKNVKDYSTNSVAQLTFAFVLNQLNSLEDYTNYTRKGLWCDSTSFTCQNWPIHELSSTTWGIIGLGTIGQTVANLASIFGAKVQYYSTSGKNHNSKYAAVSLSDLLETSNIISIHAPLNDQTKNLLDKNQLAKIQENSILVNVGRGGIINEKDLYEALQNKVLKVCLDVAENEPMQKDSYLYKLKDLDSVQITPHIAWASQQAQRILIDKVFEHIKEFLNHSLS